MFGEAILGLSQGSVSELLTKPKPWHMLSIKGREPFIRMHLWLNDPNNVEKLQAMKEERDSLKRRHTVDQLQRTDEQQQPSSPKRHRASLTGRQKEALEVAFSLDADPGLTSIEFISRELGVDSKIVAEWFAGKRADRPALGVDPLGQTKQEQHLGASGVFDPLHFRLLVNQRLLRGGDVGDDDTEEEIASETFDAGDHSGEDENSRQSGGCDADGRANSDHDGETSATTTLRGRSSRRKPLAPQWVNPTSTAADVVVPNGDEEGANDENDDSRIGDDVEEEP